MNVGSERFTMYRTGSTESIAFQSGSKTNRCINYLVPPLHTESSHFVQPVIISFKKMHMPKYKCRWDLRLRYPHILHHRPWKHGQTTDPIQSMLWSSHKTRLAPDADMGFIVLLRLTKWSSFPETNKLHWVKQIYLWFVRTLLAERQRWNCRYNYFIVG